MKSRAAFKACNPTGETAMDAEIRRQCVGLNAEYFADTQKLRQIGFDVKVIYHEFKKKFDI